jgi:hypothetical protein
VEVAKACRREAAARKMDGERCVLILSCTCLWRGEVCEQCRICNQEFRDLSKSPFIVKVVKYRKL